MEPSLLLSLGAFLTPPLCRQQASGGSGLIRKCLYIQSYIFHDNLTASVSYELSQPFPFWVLQDFESQHWFHLPVASTVTEDKALTQH